MKAVLNTISLILAAVASSRAIVLPVSNGGSTLAPDNPSIILDSSDPLTIYPPTITNLTQPRPAPDFTTRLWHHNYLQIRIRTHHKLPVPIPPRTSKELYRVIELDYGKVPINSQEVVGTGKRDVHFRNTILDLQSSHLTSEGPEKLTLGVVKDTFETIGKLITSNPDYSQDFDYEVYDLRPQHGRMGKELAAGSLTDHQRGT